ncbi:hypothetical protein EJ02DRAFT_100302 [Clathrospora elynae]|uniref:Uncharacterized protein n=1 Tax=Clathrospora elynae TaxID=706981 RepID=A0A6A5SX41_9PLEO|nr:hypothetical protein EJ02DRAFT_100302 [Clathrospora elynae]
MPWLFGRRRGKAARLHDGAPAAVTEKRSITEQTDTTPSSRAPGRRRRRSSSRSTTASMRDEPWPRASAEDITALPLQRRLPHSPHLFHSHASLPPAAKERGKKLQRPQSMRQHPPTDSSLVRRKSSKRRKEHDHIREDEIRAMAFPMPQKRPAGSSGGMLRRDSKKAKAGLNQRFERAASNASLPLGDSLHSDMSGSSEARAFRVSALDMFSPRPTIRVSVGSNYYTGERTSPSTYDRSTSRRDRRPLSSTDDKYSRRSSRIDDLADALNAGALRDILERDKRQREKQARTDQERLRRRLERRAEQQHAASTRGTPAAPHGEGMDVVGLGIDKEAPMPMEGVRPSTPPQPTRLQMPVTPRAHNTSQLPTPVDSPVDEPVVSDARAIRYSRGSVSAQVHTRGPSNASVLPELLSEKYAHDTPMASIEHAHDPTRSGSLHPVETVDTVSTSRWSSTRRRSSESRRMSVFASFFRRGKRNSQEQGQTTPSEVSFSNTSRESMSRQPLPPHLVGTVPATPPIQIRRPSSVPRRTMSKFREDLPEFPLSPPDSRVHSPEVSSTSAIAARRRSQHPADLLVQSVTSPVGRRSDSPVSLGAPVGNVMSQSLASVDSEASWLSGRPLKRASNKSQIHSSIKSSAMQRNEDFSASYEELGVADDEYFKRLTPFTHEHHQSPYASDEQGKKASSTLIALDTTAESNEEPEPTPAPIPSGEEKQLVKSSVGRQPTIIHRRPRVKSTEGLLSIFLDDTDDIPSKAAYMGPETPDSPISPASDTEPAMVQRAKSVDLGKHHVRHLSAGSARLLDIQKRSSTSSHGIPHSKMSEQ